MGLVAYLLYTGLFLAERAGRGAEAPAGPVLTQRHAHGNLDHVAALLFGLLAGGEMQGLFHR